MATLSSLSYFWSEKSVVHLGLYPLQIFAQHLIFWFFIYIVYKRKGEREHYVDQWAPVQNEDVWAFQSVHVPEPEVHQRTQMDNLA